MVELRVAFKVPRWIDQGLRSGDLERVGGVIRETGSKKVVSWLRETGVDPASMAGGGAPGLLGSLGSLARIANLGVSVLNLGATVYYGRKLSRELQAGLAEQGARMDAGFAEQIARMDAGHARIEGQVVATGEDVKRQVVATGEDVKRQVATTGTRLAQQSAAEFWVLSTMLQLLERSRERDWVIQLRSALDRGERAYRAADPSSRLAQLRLAHADADAALHVVCAQVSKRLGELASIRTQRASLRANRIADLREALDDTRMVLLAVNAVAKMEAEAGNPAGGAELLRSRSAAIREQVHAAVHAFVRGAPTTRKDGDPYDLEYFMSLLHCKEPQRLPLDRIERLWQVYGRREPEREALLPTLYRAGCLAAVAHQLDHWREMGRWLTAEGLKDASSDPAAGFMVGTYGFVSWPEVARPEPSGLARGPELQMVRYSCEETRARLREILLERWDSGWSAGWSAGLRAGEAAGETKLKDEVNKALSFVGANVQKTQASATQRSELVAARLAPETLLMDARPQQSDAHVDLLAVCDTIIEDLDRSDSNALELDYCAANKLEWSEYRAQLLSALDVAGEPKSPLAFIELGTPRELVPA